MLNKEMTVMEIAQKVKALKPGKPFTVTTNRERQAACRIGKTLRDAGAIQFSVVTRADNGIFTVAAI